MKTSQRRLARLAFYSHLWVGVLSTVLLLIIGITGILLNHKTSLNLMPDVENTAIDDVRSALPLSAIVDESDTAILAELGAVPEIDRIDVRLRSGLAKVRYRDTANHEVTLDLSTGEILEIGERNDVFLEKLHSGEVFGDGWILLSDAAAMGLILLLISGYWLWLFPRWRHRDKTEASL